MYRFARRNSLGYGGDPSTTIIIKKQQHSTTTTTISFLRVVILIGVRFPTARWTTPLYGGFFFSLQSHRRRTYPYPRRPALGGKDTSLRGFPTAPVITTATGYHQSVRDIPAQFQPLQGVPPAMLCYSGCDCSVIAKTRPNII